jgi:hypothetical protein
MSSALHTKVCNMLWYEGNLTMNLNILFVCFKQLSKKQSVLLQTTITIFFVSICLICSKPHISIIVLFRRILVFQLLKYKYGNDTEPKFSKLQLFQHKSHRNSLTFISNKTVLYRIRMFERGACNNFAVNVKRLVSPGNFVLTSCVPAVTGIQLSNTQRPNLPVVLRLLCG